MPLTPAQRKANDKYIKAHYRQVRLSMPNAEAEALERYCALHGVSKAGFIRSLIREAIQASTTPPVGDMVDEPGPNKSPE